MNKRKLDKGTIVRTVLLVLTWVNQILIFIGESPFGVNPIYLWASLIVTLIMTVINYWYNNNWTDFAKMAQDIFVILKDGKVTKEELADFLKNHHKPPGNINNDDEKEVVTYDNPNDDDN